MKSIFRKILLIIISAVTAFACTSCSYLPNLDFLSSLGKKPTGIYGDIDEKGFGYTYAFDGDEVTYSLWNNGESEVLVKAPYEIKGGKIKIISDEYFHGSVEENGKYVVSKSISFVTDENGNESIKIGVNSFCKMEEEDLPTNPDPENPDPENPDPENPDPENPQKPDDDKNTTTTVTLEEFKNTLIEAGATENKNFEASYILSEKHTQDGSHTEEITYRMDIKAKGTDRYLKFQISSRDKYDNNTHTDVQTVELWSVGGATYIKTEFEQRVNNTTPPKETNVAKASGQTFNSVCENLGFPTLALLSATDTLSDLLTDTEASLENKNGTVEYALDCTGKTDALSALYRMSKAFAVEMSADKLDDADVNYKVTSDALTVDYTGSFSEPSRNSTVNGTINFKSFNSEITVPSEFSSAVDEGSGYKSWYSGLDLPHR